MKKGIVPRRRKALPIVAAVVQPVTRRLARMEALLLEMRHEQDVKLRRIGSLEAKLETLTEDVRANTRRLSRRGNR